MDERDALALVAEAVSAAGDDAATVDGTVITTDMLHERTDFPDGTTRYTAGWRAVGASLSDVAATGAEAIAAVAVYAAPRFDAEELRAFLDGAAEVCAAVDARYVGGDLDRHDEFTVATTAIGETSAPVGRGGASAGDTVCVTGPLGGTAAAIDLFESEPTRANELFRFTPRVATGQELAKYASAMTDSSDGLARALHNLSAASGCGFNIEGDAVPIHEALSTQTQDRLQRAVTYGEDFELVVCVPPDEMAAARAAVPSLTAIGEATEADVSLDGTPLQDVGYTHGS
jgi:thiamine-monophosphate kinase